MRGLITMVPGIGTDTHILAVPYKGETFDVGGAVTLGIPVQRFNGLVWALAAEVAAAAGPLLEPVTFVHANMGFIGLKAFPTAIVGGFGSLPGASWAA